ncbi:LOW QUALITY PROTEIN: Fanconi anemia group B protein [Ctenodactylus gundi]
MTQASGQERKVIFFQNGTPRVCPAFIGDPCAFNESGSWMEHMKSEAIKDFPKMCFCKRPSTFYRTLFKWKQEHGEPLIEFCAMVGHVKAMFWYVLLQCPHNLIRVLPINYFLRNLKLGNEDFPVEHLTLTLEKELVTLGSRSSFALAKVESNSEQSCEASQGNKKPKFKAIFMAQLSVRICDEIPLTTALGTSLTFP